MGTRPQSPDWINMQKHITGEIQAAADPRLQSGVDAVAAALQFVRDVTEDHAEKRAKATLKLPFGAERKAAAVDGAISSVAEHAVAEYVRQIARGEGPPARQQFSLGNQLTWNPGRALPQFLFQGKPILLTDPEQVARWDQLVKQEAEEHAPGRMAQLFKVQSKPTPRHVSVELENLAEGKIIFQSADRPGWDKVIYYRAGEKRAAERLAEILSNNRKLTEQQQAEVWRLEGWPEADIVKELERMRHVQQMHDESWWTPPPSLMERARQYAKDLLAFGRGNETTPISAKAEPEQAQRFVGEIQRPPKQIAELVPSALPNAPERAEAEHVGSKAIALPRSATIPSTIAGFHQADAHAAARPDLNRARTNGVVKSSAEVSRQDERVFRWLDAAMEDVHRSAQRPRLRLKGRP
jgi:hypothetical protein